MSRSAILSLTLLMCLSTLASAAEKPDTAYARGLESYGAGNLRDAISRFEQVYAANPGYREVREYLLKAYKFLGIEYYSNGRYEEAIQLWRRAMEIDPDNAEIRSYIARAQGEMEAMTKISGENPPIAVESSSPEAAPAEIEPEKEPATAASSSVSDASHHPPESYKKRPSVATTLKIGPAFPVGKTTEKHGVGWQLSGGISHRPVRFPLGLYLEGTYIRLPVNKPPTAPAGTHAIVSMTGASAGTILSAEALGIPEIRMAAAAGLYEVVKAGYNTDLMRETTDIDLSPGYCVTLALTSKLGLISVNTETRFLHVRSSLAPDLLQLYIGLNAGL